MPQGIGKIRSRARVKFPRIFGFYDRYHTTITALAIIFFVSAVAYIGITSNEIANTVTKVRGDVNVIKQQSPCLAASEEPTKAHIKLCHQSFGKAINLVTAPQACRLIQKGSALLVINGQRIKGIECIFPNGHQSPHLESSNEGRRGSTAPPSSGSKHVSQGASGTDNSGGGGNGHSGHPGSPEGGTGGNGGAGNGGGSEGGEEAPVGQPEGSPPPQEEPVSEEGSGGGSNQNPGGVVSGVVEGVGKVVKELVCHPNLLGVEVCTLLTH